jgi:hypothetical protein
MPKLLASVLAVFVAALAVAGCGGQKVSADEVPGPPVALKVPEVTKGGSDALAGNSSSSSSNNSSSQDSSATPTPTATAQSDTSGASGTSGTTQSGNTGGTSGTSGTSQQQTQQGNGGTNGQSQGGGGNTFDDFCKNNPGAC